MAQIMRIDEMSSNYEKNEYCVYEYASMEYITKGRLNREIRTRGVVRKPKLIKSFDTFKKANEYANKMLEDVYGTDVYYSLYLFKEIENEYAHLDRNEIIKDFTFFDPDTLNVVEDEYMTHYAKVVNKRVNEYASHKGSSTIDKINNITHNISLLGGTNVFWNSHFSVLFETTTYGTKGYIIKKIEYDYLIIKDEGKRYPDMKMPLNWLSESYLEMILQSYIEECKNSLTDDAFKRVMK